MNNNIYLFLDFKTILYYLILISYYLNTLHVHWLLLHKLRAKFLALYKTLVETPAVQYTIPEIQLIAQITNENADGRIVEHSGKSLIVRVTIIQSTCC